MADASSTDVAAPVLGALTPPAIVDASTSPPNPKNAEKKWKSFADALRNSSGAEAIANGQVSSSDSAPNTDSPRSGPSSRNSSGSTLQADDTENKPADGSVEAGDVEGFEIVSHHRQKSQKKPNAHAAPEQQRSAVKVVKKQTSKPKESDGPKQEKHVKTEPAKSNPAKEPKTEANHAKKNGAWGQSAEEKPSADEPEHENSNHSSDSAFADNPSPSHASTTSLHFVADTELQDLSDSLVALSDDEKWPDLHVATSNKEPTAQSGIPSSSNGRSGTMNGNSSSPRDGAEQQHNEEELPVVNHGRRNSRPSWKTYIFEPCYGNAARPGTSHRSQNGQAGNGGSNNGSGGNSGGGANGGRRGQQAGRNFSNSVEGEARDERQNTANGQPRRNAPRRNNNNNNGSADHRQHQNGHYHSAPNNHVDAGVPNGNPPPVAPATNGYRNFHNDNGGFDRSGRHGHRFNGPQRTEEPNEENAFVNHVNDFPQLAPPSGSSNGTAQPQPQPPQNNNASHGAVSNGGPAGGNVNGQMPRRGTGPSVYPRMSMQRGVNVRFPQPAYDMAQLNYIMAQGVAMQHMQQQQGMPNGVAGAEAQPSIAGNPQNAHDFAMPGMPPGNIVVPNGVISPHMHAQMDPQAAAFMANQHMIPQMQAAYQEMPVVGNLTNMPNMPGPYPVSYVQPPFAPAPIEHQIAPPPRYTIFGFLRNAHYFGYPMTPETAEFVTQISELMSRNFPNRPADDISRLSAGEVAGLEANDRTLLIKQWYFSPANVVRDVHLKSLMDEDAFVPASALCGFPRMKIMGATESCLATIAGSSDVLEVADAETDHPRIRSRFPPEGFVEQIRQGVAEMHPNGVAPPVHFNGIPPHINFGVPPQMSMNFAMMQANPNAAVQQANFVEGENGFAQRRQTAGDIDTRFRRAVNLRAASEDNSAVAPAEGPSSASDPMSPPPTYPSKPQAEANPSPPVNEVVRNGLPAIPPRDDADSTANVVNGAEQWTYPRPNNKQRRQRHGDGNGKA